MEGNMESIGDRYHFHRECIHYDSVVKTPEPERGHPNRIRVKCEMCQGKGSLYFNDSDFENIRTGCMYFEPKEPTLFDLMEE